MLTHNGHEYRPSGVPGIVIFGRSSRRDLTLCVEVKDRFVLITRRDVNEFPTVRAAKGAAQRIAGILPWDSPDLYDVAQADRATNELLVRTALAEGK